MKKQLCLALLALFFVNIGFGQDSQFPIAPQTFSPAMTGFTSADVRTSYNYYSLAPTYSNSKYQNGLFSIDAPLLRGRLPKGDALGIGLCHSFYSSRRYVSNNNFGLSVAYHKAFGAKRNQYVSAGVQGLLYMMKTSNDWYKDMSYIVGATYTRQLADKATVYAGLSASLGSIFPGSQKIIYVGGACAINSRLSVYSSALLFPSLWEHEKYLVTANAGYVLNKKSKIPTTVYAGASIRWDDYFAPYIGIERWGLRLGLSREWNISPSDPMWGGDAYEISLQWLGRFKKHTNKLKDVKPLPRIY